MSLSALLLSACTQIGAGVANLPVKFNDVQIEKNIAYGAADIQKLDVYLPPNVDAKAALRPVIVFFYGGRWTDGTKGMYGFIGDRFAKEGYVVVVADYSKYPAVKFPNFVEDGAKAVAWTFQNIEKYGGDKNNIFVMGHSSGAHIGALVAADEKYLKAEGVKNTDLRGFVGLAGPYDFIPQEEDLKDMFGPLENYPKMQVTNFIEGNEPPMLLIWGAEDKLVYRRNIDLLAQKIQDKGGQVDTIIYPTANHFSLIVSQTWFIKDKDNVAQDIIKFFERRRR